MDSGGSGGEGLLDDVAVEDDVRIDMAGMILLPLSLSLILPIDQSIKLPPYIHLYLSTFQAREQIFLSSLSSLFSLLYYFM